MRQSIPTTAAALLSLFSTAMTKTIVRNDCTIPVYVWLVLDEPIATLKYSTVTKDQPWSQEYANKTSGGGPSIYVSNTTDYTQPHTQFEYKQDAKVWYDMSNINGYPFGTGGMNLSTSSPDCPFVDCPASDPPLPCKVAYNVPDDTDTKACDYAEDLEVTLHLCPELATSAASKRTAHQQRRHIGHLNQHRSLHQRHMPVQLN
ncbi:hypothetical protein MMC09_005258 [Bachmanniomyces sp. S44760]|nr:hypothetical protein [Bachmanniomyces sp. S44760]